MIGTTVSHYKILEKIGGEEWASSSEPKKSRLDRLLAPDTSYEEHDFIF